jgi:ElaB/YqjD/DUF883 family membrane-anchored ribosome-binding protein
MESASDSTIAHKAERIANGAVNSFLDSVEDLTNALKDIDSPDIARVRTKVRIALMAAKSAASDTATQIGSQARQIGKRTDGFVRDNPWQVIGIAAAVGLAVGLLAGRRSS